MRGRVYYIAADGRKGRAAGKGGGCRHYGMAEAEAAVSRIFHTDKTGTRHYGARWSPEEVSTMTARLEFKECVTEGDKYVAFNAAYADLCKVFAPDLIVTAAHAFFFCDEDAPCGKVRRYMEAMQEGADEDF